MPTNIITWCTKRQTSRYEPCNVISRRHHCLVPMKSIVLVAATLFEFKITQRSIQSRKDGYEVKAMISKRNTRCVPLASHQGPL